MKNNEKLSIAKKNILRDSYNPKYFTKIKGYEFNNGLDYDKLLDSYSSGVEVIGVNIQSCQVPERVRPSFNMVNQAMQEKEQKINGCQFL